MKHKAIDPMKTALYHDVKDIRSLRGLIMLGLIENENVDIKKLINTTQYLFEVIERMEDHDSYISCILTSEQRDQMMRDRFGWTDKTFKKSKEDSKKMLEKLQKELFNKAV